MSPEQKDALIEAVYEALADCDELVAIEVLTEAAHLRAASFARAITVEVPMTMEEAVRRLMVRKGCDEQQAREIVEWAIASDRPPKSPGPRLTVVR